jgi:hypothetical protein
MNESKDFLRFVINEDIYQIDEKGNESIDMVDKSASEQAVEIKEESSEVNVNPPVKRESEILVLFDNMSSANILDTEKAYLGKIAGAIGRSTDKMDFQNISKMQPDVSGYKHILAFTPNHKLKVDLATQQYLEVDYQDSVLIIADSLTNIAASPDLRKKLWGVLQSAFL